MMKYFAILIVLGSIGFSTSKVVPFFNCSYPEGTEISCKVHEVRINPCKIIPHQANACSITRGQNASMEFDYTANFEGNSLESCAYYNNDGRDFAYPLRTNACTSTVCPVQPGQKQTYNITLFVSPEFSARLYRVKWKLWNPQQQECCFMFHIKLPS
ncbi:MD-2-related lipid-recognition protein-like [Microplitis mediator]|uniref:MD-2-related lipid-recognition protein-like n=1 Tax=Microplitis mediator TaxID=375433 RepID=UPI00255752CC|nr:MD-2-related lipid-recognition protein-like [Microplitis mediator]XP_057337480.1 MD-2-related lipid-recognition protein-like [Microplitis mediator]